MARAFGGKVLDTPPKVGFIAVQGDYTSEELPIITAIRLVKSLPSSSSIPHQIDGGKALQLRVSGLRLLSKKSPEGPSNLEGGSGPSLHRLFFTHLPKCIYKNHKKNQ